MNYVEQIEARGELGDEAPAYRLSAAVDHRHLGIASPSRGVIDAVRSGMERAP